MPAHDDRSETSSDAPGSLEERTAAAFLEMFVAERLAGRAPTLAESIARFPGFEARIAREWLAANGGAGSEEAPDARRGNDHRGAGDRAIGPYRLVNELGRGGQGVVYLAEDTRVSRTVALKVMERAPHALDSPAYLRFRREADALARLDHRNVATVFEVGESDDAAWIAMRLVTGGSLAQVNATRIARGDGPPRTTEEIAAVVADWNGRSSASVSNNAAPSPQTSARTSALVPPSRSGAR